MWTYNQANYLCHFGVPGMKWGHRKASYDTPKMSSSKRALYDAKANKRIANDEYNQAYKKARTITGAYGKNANANAKELERSAKAADKADSDYKSAKKAYNQTDEHKNNVKKAAIAGAAVAGTALAAYGTYKLVKVMQNKKALELGQKAAEEAVRKSVAENRMLHELANEMMKTSTSGHVVDSLGRTVAKWG